MTRRRAAATRIEARDRRLRKRLRALSDADPEYWSFRSNAARQHAHAFFQYPAMMVPQMQARLLADVMAVDPRVKRAYDPFIGSGTVLTEAMLLGLDFHGCDVNPLAVLLSRVKSGPFFIDALQDRWNDLKARIEEDGGCGIEARFPGWRKWFDRPVAIRLSRIVRGIRALPDIWSRRFFWVALAETVRVSSNSRTSTFKLHIRPADELATRDVDPLATFVDVAERNLERAGKKLELLREAGQLKSGRYAGSVTVGLGDAGADALAQPKRGLDLMVTSPPYGDNTSTVPYGQHSFLPLQWIDLDDIEPGLDRSLIGSTSAIDARSLGGSRNRALAEVEPVCERSPALQKTLKALKSQPRDRQVRVAAFWRDMDSCVKSVLGALRQNAYMLWIVGNRRVGNRAVPMHQILSELVVARGGVEVAVLERRIHSKRMAARNDIARTMSRERVLVMRKATA